MLIVRINDGVEEVTEIEMQCAFIGGVSVEESKKNKEEVKKTIGAMTAEYSEIAIGVTFMAAGKFSMAEAITCAESITKGVNNEVAIMANEIFTSEELAIVLGFTKGE